jgi:cytochrome oxidase assembly protein ShyY1
VTKWRFALQRRWVTYFVMAVVFAIACAFLSRWQFGRNEQVSAEHTLVFANYAAKPVSLPTLVPTQTSYSARTAWRRVMLEGTYLTSRQLLVRDRSYGSNPGFDVLTPLRLSNGSVFIVDRGWVPVGTLQDRPDFVPAPPAGKVTVIARLQGSEPVLPGRVAPSGEISEINLPTVAKSLGARASSTYTAAFGLLSTETPAPATRPLPAKKPVLDNGPFLSYAFQWILFALLAFGGLFWALRAEYRVVNAEDPDEMRKAAERARKAASRPPSDADIEDGQIREALDREDESRQVDATSGTARSASLVDAGWRPLEPDDYKDL